jgi:RimJ/RimL family protein N-acetyltransferase
MNCSTGERLLEGKKVNLRVVEKEDLSLLLDWFNSPEVAGMYEPLDPQQSKKEFENRYDKLGPDEKFFFIEKKDGSRIGSIGHYPKGSMIEIGYCVLPDERGRGCCTEAVQILVDYLFLSRDIVRVQAHTHTGNRASQMVLEKSGFTREGIVRKDTFARGEWRDSCLYSILREEWKEPRMLTRT